MVIGPLYSQLKTWGHIFRLFFGILYDQQPHLSRSVAKDNVFVVPSVEARALIIVLNDLGQ